MKIVDLNGEKIDNSILNIVEGSDGFTYLKKVNNDVYINKVLMESRFVSVSYGDIIEFELKGRSYKCVVMEEDNEMNNQNLEKIIRPFVVPPYQLYPQNTGYLAILYTHNNYKEWLFKNCNLIWAYRWIWDKIYWHDFVSNNDLIGIKRVHMGWK